MGTARYVSVLVLLANSLLEPAVAVLLFLAAILKLLDPSGGRWVGVEALVEMGVAFWLLLGRRRYLAKSLVLFVMFLGFAAISLSMAVDGRTSCGCFGEVTVHPWIVFGLDLLLLVAIMALISCSGSRVHFTRLAKLTVMATVILAISVSNKAVWNGNGERRTYLLDSEEWIGTRFPILEDIEIDVELGDSAWLVVFYHYDCAKCRGLISLLIDRREGDSNRQIALIEVPPYSLDEFDAPACHKGKLLATKEWIGELPIVVALNDGICVSNKP